MRMSSSIRQFLALFGMTVWVAVALAIPAAYLVNSLVNTRNLAEFKAELGASRLAKYVLTRENLWQYHKVRIAELIELPGQNIRQTIHDAAGNHVLTEGPEQPGPYISVVHPVVVRGETVAHFTVVRTIRGQLGMAGTIALFSTLLGGLAYLVMRQLPLKALDKAISALETANSHTLVANARLKEQNSRFDAAMANMSHGLCMVSRSGELVVANRRFGELFKLEGHLLLPGTNVQVIIAASVLAGNHGPITPDALLGQFRQMMSTKTKVTFNLKLADARTIELTYNPLADGGWLCLFEDISERVETEQRISHMARHDTLTGLPNRLKFNEQMTESFGLMRGPEDGFVLMLLDLDEFKSINDTLGHPSGDELLKQVAHRLEALMGSKDKIARLGGDEFAILFDEVHTADEAAQIARSIIETVSEPYVLFQDRAVIGTSIGIAFAPGDGLDADTIIKNVDMALYRAKSDGRGTFRFFEADMDAKAQARRHIELELREAHANGQLELYYQPIMDVLTHELRSFEALMRWHHPVRGFVSPAEFIPVAEETGLIHIIGDWAIRKACADAMSWPAHVGVAVNLSAVQFGKATLPHNVAQALAVSGLSPHRLELEITESVLLKDSEKTLGILHQIRNLGVRIALDDFGTGFSSLSYLRSFPFDKIKIDQSFVQDMKQNRDSDAIVKAIAALGIDLGMTTVAEGVETDEQLAAIGLRGCTEVQGYLFGRPTPMTGMTELITRLNTEKLSAASAA